MPGRSGSLRVGHLEEPAAGQGSVLVRALALGVCATDRELIEGHYGEAPEGRSRLVIGHESLGEVLDAPAASGLRAGERVVGIVRHPDPVPCASCALGEWDMCRNGRFTERGIKQADGFGAKRWRAEPGFLVPVSAELGLAGVLLEPASVVAKAWEHIERIARRSRRTAQSVLVTGAGPIGLLAALLGIQRRLEVHVVDRNEDGPKPALVRALGAQHHVRFPDLEPDVVIECTGAPPVIAQAIERSGPGAIVCLTGLGKAKGPVSLDVAAFNDAMVLGNRVVFGSVNANLRHYRQAAEALEAAERGWLDQVITRKVRPQEWAAAYEHRPGDVKTVVRFED
jgi:glucose 1-dehydrogenase